MTEEELKNWTEMSNLFYWALTDIAQAVQDGEYYDEETRQISIDSVLQALREELIAIEYEE